MWKQDWKCGKVAAMGDFDAEDLPHWWQRWLAEGVGVAVAVVIVVGVAILAQPLGPMLPRVLDWLSGLI